MLKVFTDNLVFQKSDQTSRYITVTNVHQTNSLVYKVRTNNLNVIEATPNCGLMRAKCSLSLLIKTKSTNPFQAKLQIIYGDVGEKINDFNACWASLKSQDMRKQQIKVIRPSEDMKSSNQISQNIQQGKNNEFGSMPDLEKMDQQLKQKLRQQNLENLRMRQQIEITEEKLREINQERLQIKVNKSIGVICEEYHTSFTTLLLYGLAVFVLGYAIAKYE